MNKIMCEFDPPYKCKYCGEELLFFVTDRNKLIDYKRLYEESSFPSDLYHTLVENRVKHMKCIVCGKRSFIDWSRCYPRQLLDRDELKKFGV